MSEQTSMRLEILPENEAEFGPCECCGNKTRRVWGYVYSDEAALAAYYVEWTPGHSDANFDLILGRWGDEAQSADRVSVAIEFRILESGPAFHVINAGERLYAKSSLVGKALSRETVLAGEMRQQVFDVLDLIYADDSRLDALRAQR